MTLHQLKILMAVAKYLSFRRAAEELHISQPSVFVQFKNLEQEYNLKLYKKKGRGIELTNDAEAFLTYASAILSQVESFERRFRHNKQDRKPIGLKIGASHGPSTALLPRLLAAFRADHPNVGVTLRTQSSHLIEEMVLAGDVDLGVITNPSSSVSIIYEQYRKEAIVAFASPKYFKSRRLTLTELARAPLVFSSDATRGQGEMIPNLFLKHNLTPNVVMQCDSPEAVKAAVKMGAGVGILNREALDPELKSGDLKTVRVQQLAAKSYSFLIYHKEKPLSAQATTFISLLRTSINKTPRTNPLTTDIGKVPEP